MTICLRSLTPALILLSHFFANASISNAQVHLSSKLTELDSLQTPDKESRWEKMLWANSETLIFSTLQSIQSYNVATKKIDWEIRYKEKISSIDCNGDKVLIVFRDHVKALDLENGKLVWGLNSEQLVEILELEPNEIEVKRIMGPSIRLTKNLMFGFLMTENRVALVEGKMKYSQAGHVIDIRDNEKLSLFHVDSIPWFWSTSATDRFLCTATLLNTLSIRDVSNDKEIFVSPEKPRRDRDTGTYMRIDSPKRMQLHYCDESQLLVFSQTQPWGDGDKIEIYDVEKSCSLRTIEVPDWSPIDVNFAKRVIVCATAKQAMFFDFDGNSQFRPFVTKFDDKPRSTRLSPSGKLLAVLSGSRITVFSLED